MGQLALEDFRNRLGFVVRKANVEKAMLDLWINSAYFELVGAQAFDALKEDISVTIDGGTNSAPVPERTLSILALFDDVSEYEVLYVNPETFRKLILDDGDVSRWTQIGNEIFVWGRPLVDVTLSGIAIFEPDRLMAPEDRTAIPSTWDEAIFLLSAEKALLDLEDDDRAMKYAARAIEYMRSRADEGTYTMRRQGEGLNIISSEWELRKMRVR